MTLSKNLSRSEFACKCGRCGFDTADVELVGMVQDVRDHFGTTVIITSACRCPKYNKAVGGGDKSQHLLGRAADIVVPGVSPAEVHRYLFDKYPDQYGLGRYDTFTHVDSRRGPARWGG